MKHYWKRLQLSDGTIYPHSGKITYIASALDATTGTFALRAEFPNPKHYLIPGLFARIRIVLGLVGSDVACAVRSRRASSQTCDA